MKKYSAKVFGRSYQFTSEWLSGGRAEFSFQGQESFSAHLDPGGILWIRPQGAEEELPFLLSDFQMAGEQGGVSFLVRKGRRLARPRVELEEQLPEGVFNSRKGPAGSLRKKKVISPMTGKVIAILLEAGSAVEGGQAVLIVEAMKMENKIVAPLTGRVATLSVTVGAQVKSGQELFVIEGGDS